jgi:hypothetical protein
MQGMIDGPTDELREIIQGAGLRHLWQTFMTGSKATCKVIQFDFTLAFLRMRI